MKLSRRSFLRLVGLGGAAAALPLPTSAAPALTIPHGVRVEAFIWPEFAWKSIVVPIEFPPGRVAEVRAFIDRAIDRDDAAAREWLARDLFAPQAPERVARPPHNNL